MAQLLTLKKRVGDQEALWIHKKGNGNAVTSVTDAKPFKDMHIFELPLKAPALDLVVRAVSRIGLYQKRNAALLFDDLKYMMRGLQPINAKV
jgi:hypothetical protein